MEMIVTALILIVIIVVFYFDNKATKTPQCKPSKVRMISINIDGDTAEAVELPAGYMTLTEDSAYLMLSSLSARIEQYTTRKLVIRNELVRCGDVVRCMDVVVEALAKLHKQLSLEVHRTLMMEIIGGIMSDKCKCRGCRFTRDPRSGYQPCQHSPVQTGTQPGDE